MPGFDCNRFVGLSEKETKHLCCSICLNIFSNAVTADCGHNYCKQCIEEWIVSHPNETSVEMVSQKRCPECRQVFRRKGLNKRMENTNLLFISGYVFPKSLVINSMVSELKVKCDYQSNGCKEVIEFGLLWSHIENCEHRLCKTCGLSAGKVGEHNCIELLKTIIREMEINLFEMKIKFDSIKAKQVLESVNIPINQRVDTTNSSHAIHTIDIWDDSDTN